MNGMLLDFLTFAGALALAVYGIKLLSEGAQRLSTGWVRRALSAMGRGRMMGLLGGLMTALLVQSAASTTVLVVEFVNAEILSLLQSVTVIMGANVGVTAMAWLVVWLGFDWSVGLYALPVIACAIPFIFSSNGRRRSVGEVLLGFSLVFIGLFLLQGCVPSAATNPDIFAFWARYCGGGLFSVLLFLFLGVVVTSVVQSSQAALILILLIGTAGWVPFEMCLGMVLGVNLGSAIPPVLSSMAGNLSARRAALVHLLFNAVGCLWMLILFYPCTKGLSYLLTLVDVGNPAHYYRYLQELDAATLRQINNSHAVLTPTQYDLQAAFVASRVAVGYGVACFHTLFNLFNAILLAWFDKYLVQVATRIFPQRDEDETFRLTHLEGGVVSTAELSLLQADKEILVYAKRCARMFDIARSLYGCEEEAAFDQIFTRVQKYEEISDRMEMELANYLSRTSEHRLSDGAKHDVVAMLRAVSDLENLADGCNALAHAIARRRKDAIPYTVELDNQVNVVFQTIQSGLDTLLALLPETNLDEKYRLLELARKQANEFAELMDRFKLQNASDVNDRRYPFQVSVTYMAILDHCAKMADAIASVIDQYGKTRKGAI